MPYTRQDVAAGIVLYQPDLKRLVENIESILPQVDHVVLIDNGSTNIDLILEQYKCNSSISIVRNEKNCGIARALNQICQWAMDHHYHWCVTLDQDSCADKEMVNGFLQYEGLNDQIGIIHPHRRDRNLNLETLQYDGDYEEITDSMRVITSGCMMNLAVWQKLGGFLEELFIDYVDYEFNERLLRAGYRIIRAHKSVILHELGHRTAHNYRGHTVYATNHSAFRRYYMTRNASFFFKKYRSKEEQRKHKKHLLRSAWYILLFEKDRIKKIVAMIRGRASFVGFYNKYKNKAL